MAGMDKEIERIDRGGDAWGKTDKVVSVEVKKPLKKIIRTHPHENG